MMLTGVLFAFAVCQLDPVRRRRSPAVRGAALAVAGVAHGVLAKTLYALPPPGTRFTAADLHSGAQWMYYGGDLVEAALAVALGVGWFTAGGRARERRMRRERGIGRLTGPAGALADRQEIPERATRGGTS
jgi:putative membrane protein